MTVYLNLRAGSVHDRRFLDLYPEARLMFDAMFSDWWKR